MTRQDNVKEQDAICNKRSTWLLRPGRKLPPELDFNGLTAYSALVHRHRYGRAMSARQVADACGLDRCRAIYVSLRQLSDLELVHKSGRRWVASEPPAGWFQSRMSDQADWWTKFAYTKVIVPARKANRLLSRANALYWLLTSIQRMGRLGRFKRTGLATMLRVPSITVRRSLKSLRSLGLVDREGHPIPPEADHFPLWADRSRRHKPFDKGTTAAPVDLSGVAQRMTRELGVPTSLAGKLLGRAERLGLTVEQFDQLVTETDGESRVEYEAGRQRVRHCGYLVEHRLKNLAPAKRVVVNDVAKPWALMSRTRQIYDLAVRLSDAYGVDRDQANDLLESLDSQIGKNFVGQWCYGESIIPDLVERALRDRQPDDEWDSFTTFMKTDGNAHMREVHASLQA